MAAMPCTLWDEWIQFFQLEPWGGPQEDLRAGMVASLIYNANRGKNDKAKGPADFFPSLAPGGARELSTPQQLRRNINATMMALGGKGAK